MSAPVLMQLVLILWYSSKSYRFIHDTLLTARLWVYFSFFELKNSRWMGLSRKRSILAQSSFYTRHKRSQTFITHCVAKIAMDEFIRNEGFQACMLTLVSCLMLLCGIPWCTESCQLHTTEWYLFCLGLLHLWSHQESVQNYADLNYLHQHYSDFFKFISISLVSNDVSPTQ